MRNKLFGCIKIQDKQEEAGRETLAEFLWGRVRLERFVTCLKNKQ